MGADAKIDLGKVIHSFWTFHVLAMLTFLLAERHRNQQTAFTCLSNCDRKNSTMRCAHSSLRGDHHKVSTTYRFCPSYGETRFKRTTRSSGHGQLVKYI